MTRTYQEIVNGHRESRKTDLCFLHSICQPAWDAMTKDERTLVRFGMFPHDKMQEIQAKIDQYILDAGGPGYTTLESKDSAVVLMEIAERDGGMRA